MSTRGDEGEVSEVGAMKRHSWKYSRYATSCIPVYTYVLELLYSSTHSNNIGKSQVFLEKLDTLYS